MGWLALIAALLGTGMQVAGAKKSQDEMERKVKQELLRQKGYQDEATKNFQASLAQNNVETANQDLVTGTSERQAAYEKAQATPSMDYTVPVTDQSQVLSEAAKLKNSNTTRAGVAGYDAFSLNTLLRNAEAARRQSIINNLSRGSNNVLPIELNTAGQSGAGLAQMGQLVSALGMLGGGLGGGGGGGGGKETSYTAKPVVGYGYN